MPDKVYQCHICLKELSRPTILRDHIRSHSTERPFKCSQCPKSFTRSWDLKKHQETHSRNYKHICKGVTPDGTPWGCHGRFQRRRDLERHWNRAGASKCRPRPPQVDGDRTDEVAHILTTIANVNAATIDAAATMRELAKSPMAPRLPEAPSDAETSRPEVVARFYGPQPQGLMGAPWWNTANPDMWSPLPSPPFSANFDFSPPANFGFADYPMSSLFDPDFGTRADVTENAGVDGPETQESEQEVRSGTEGGEQAQRVPMAPRTWKQHSPSKTKPPVQKPDQEDTALMGWPRVDGEGDLAQKDQLGVQIWKLYNSSKTRLPNQERMENLTWRMIAMNLQRRETMKDTTAGMTNELQSPADP